MEDEIFVVARLINYQFYNVPVHGISHAICDDSISQVTNYNKQYITQMI